MRVDDYRKALEDPARFAELCARKIALSASTQSTGPACGGKGEEAEEAAAKPSFSAKVEAVRTHRGFSSNYGAVFEFPGNLAKDAISDLPREQITKLAGTLLPVLTNAVAPPDDDRSMPFACRVTHG